MRNNRTDNENIKLYFNNNGGYASLKELKKEKYHTTSIKFLLNTDILFKVKPGLYRLTNLDESDKLSLENIDIAKAFPESVLCLFSALSYYDLTTFTSQKINIAIPRSKKISKSFTNYESLNIYYFTTNTYMLGVDEIDTKYGKIKIYDREKTICDIFRYRDKLGEDIAYESLKSYINNYKSADYLKLRNYAKICRVSKIINETLKSLLV